MRRSSYCLVFNGASVRVSLAPGSFRRIGVRTRRELLEEIQRRVLQTQFPTPTVKLWSCSEYRVRRHHSDASAAKANPSAIPINGLETANQKETFQPASAVIEFVFTLFSQAFDD